MRTFIFLACCLFITGCVNEGGLVSWYVHIHMWEYEFIYGIANSEQQVNFGLNYVEVLKGYCNIWCIFISLKCILNLLFYVLVKAWGNWSSFVYCRRACFSSLDEDWGKSYPGLCPKATKVVCNMSRVHIMSHLFNLERCKTCYRWQAEVLTGTAIFSSKSWQGADSGQFPFHRPNILAKLRPVKIDVVQRLKLDRVWKAETNVSAWAELYYWSKHNPLFPDHLLLKWQVCVYTYSKMY